MLVGTTDAGSMSIKSTIVEQIKKVAEEHNKKLKPLTDKLILLESGLDSLCLAVLVVRLEDILGIDPFNEPDNIVPITLGDFVRVYENAAR